MKILVFAQQLEVGGTQVNAIELSAELRDVHHDVVGMGGSGLRAMAFGKPVVIIGEQSFSAPFTPQTAPSFLYKGMYGVGGATLSDTTLVDDIRDLAEDPARLPGLGEFSSQFVVDHFSLETGSAPLSAFCRAAASEPFDLSVAAADGLRTMAIWIRQRLFVPVQKPFATPELSKA